METTVDSYLHKKFKKQLSIEPRTVVVAAAAATVAADNSQRHNNNDGVETSTDLRWNEKKEGASPASEMIIQDERRRNDNIHIVPNSSTNHYRSDNVVLIKNDIIQNVVKSSISLETNRLVNIQQIRDNISYIRNVNDDDDNVVGYNKSSNLDGNSYYNYDNDGEQGNNDSNTRNNKEDPIPQQQQQQDKTTGGKYVCTYCNLACSKPSVLQKHIRAHTNERPYPCVSCGFSFKTRSNLYKHCRSRTHANRVLGSKARGELTNEEQETTYENVQQETQPKTKLYKPRFHTIGTKTYNPEQQQAKENIEDENNRPSDILSHHINDIINKNNAKINADTYLKPSLNSECANVPQRVLTRDDTLKLADEPLNLTNKGRKRCISEAVESKSLIKELLLQNLSSDMQCPHCKMIFQTVTELELHKLRSCKGFVRPGAKYTRSSSVNVASILTQNKNAFDTIPQMQFPLKSPGPFLGKTRLVESDKSKSFSFDDGLPNIAAITSPKYLLSPLKLQHEEKKPPVKLFGGEVKITENTGESKSYNIEKHDNTNFLTYSGKMSENRVIKSSLQSGGTVLTNKGTFNETGLRVYDAAPATSIFNERKRPPDLIIRPTHDDVNTPSPSSYIKYTNIIDFSQNAVKLLTPNLKQPNLTVPGVPVPNKFTYNATPSSPLTQPLKIEVDDTSKMSIESQNLYNPMNIIVNGKVVRYVPGIPGPIIAETPVDMRNVPKKAPIFEKLEINVEAGAAASPSPRIVETTAAARSPVIKTTEMKSPQIKNEKKFARPNSLALKPTSASLKQHHGLTPTMFNQILISPDTPRVAKKYVQQYLNGNYFSYLGLKSTTKPVYCTLNKTQPFYVPHFKTLSMYSEWRQQDTKTDKLYVAGYDSRQRSKSFSVAGTKNTDLMAHSSYKSTTPDSSKEKDDGQKTNPILGGYESNEDYTYIRGRGRGRYVCEQCGIRCKKPSMLKKHIRTHSNDRPYTCSHCNFSFKTKGNLTKHMKSKAHTKNSTTSSSSSSSTQQSGTPSSESETEDSGMDSSDESTRQQEHEAAYGLLSLSQKSTHNLTPITFSPISTTSPINEQQQRLEQQHHSIMNIEEITHVTKTNYAKNKFLEPGILLLSNIKDMAITADNEGPSENYGFFGKTCVTRPLTYPYVMSETPIIDEPMSVSSENTDISTRIIDVTTPSDTSECHRNIKHFHVIQRYADDYSSDESYVENHHERNVNVTERSSNIAERSVIVTQNLRLIPDKLEELRKRKLSEDALVAVKLQKNDEVMDLSVRPVDEVPKPNGSFNYQETSDYRDFRRVKLNGNVEPVYETLDVRIPRAASPASNSYVDFDNSAMETLADIATKQVKLEKNAMAKSVASEYLKLATKQEFQGENERFQTKGVNDLIVKPEGSKSCTICSKSFNKPSQLRLHMNVHYLERPFRCDSCSVSFRTKGHLQKHERSASHHNKLSSSPALSSSEPRPFKCTDCNIAFRIHGHLAKHLRSKMHIMKLECLAKIPFGLYAELERSNSLLTEINTADGDQCLESLKTLAKKVFLNDPGKLKHLVETPSSELETD